MGAERWGKAGWDSFLKQNKDEKYLAKKDLKKILELLLEGVEEDANLSENWEVLVFSVISKHDSEITGLIKRKIELEEGDL